MSAETDGDRGGSRGRAEFSRDVVWNVGALALAGGLGILLNYLVGAVHGAAALGVFNQVFAIYILFSQLAALGFHYSVLTHAAAAVDDAERRTVITSALLVTGAIALVMAVVMWLAAAPLGRLLDSDDVAVGVVCVAPGIWFFALSKVTLACLNALARMRWYAVLFAGRFVVMVLAFAACAALDVDSAFLPIILTVAEAVTFVVSLIPARRHIGRVALAALRRWGRAHLRFGLKGFSSGVLAELNTRVDVLLLGFFSTDAVVGAYSFAAILAEGLLQLLVVLRTNYAPILIRLWSERRTEELAGTARRVRNRVYLASLGAGALAIALYAGGIGWVTSDPHLLESWKYFAVLCAGMVAASGYVPLQPLLLYAGMPGWHTWLVAGIVGLNALANALLIPPLGALGSALGTAAALVLGVVLFRAMAARLLGLRL